jgi:DNA mismatch repair protein MutH
MITRVRAINNLKKYIGQDLSLLADGFSVTTFLNGRQNKGWKGLVLERCAGLDNNNISAPNGIGFELKSVSFVDKKGTLAAKETMAITMINPEKLKKQEFYESGLWEKLKSLVFCAVEWKGINDKNVEFLDVTSFDFQDEQELIDEIKADYDFIRNKLITEGFEALTGRDGKWIQARTKGPGHGSTSRAFYARKGLVNRIFGK